MRWTSQDAHNVLIRPDGHPVSFFGVYDGHGGSFVSGKVAEGLWKSIEDKLTTESLQDIDELKRIVLRGFIDFDEVLRQECKKQGEDEHSGSTCVSALVTDKHILCANTGDSRCILVRDFKVKPMSDDHKPTNPKERERIQKAHGTVALGRVNGDLAVSRAFGDFAYKTGGDIDAHEQQVSVEPEFVEVERSAEDDQFLILACDGIWDVMSNEEVASFVLDAVKGGMTDMAEVSKSLIMHCLHRGSRDNMSAIIVRFNGAPSPTDEAVKRMEQKKKEEEEQRQRAREEERQDEREESREAEREKALEGGVGQGEMGGGHGQAAAEDDDDDPSGGDAS